MVIERKFFLAGRLEGWSVPRVLVRTAEEEYGLAVYILSAIVSIWTGSLYPDDRRILMIFLCFFLSNNFVWTGSLYPAVAPEAEYLEGARVGRGLDLQVVGVLESGPEDVRTAG